MLKIEMAGNTEYNGVNCRLRTAFYTSDNKQIYLSISSGVKYIGKECMHYIAIDFLFRLDIEEDRKLSYTKEYRHMVEDYHKNKREYTHANIKQLLHDLDCDDEIQYCDYYTKREYTPITDSTKDYHMGNDKHIIPDNKKPMMATQLSIFDI